MPNPIGVSYDDETVLPIEQWERDTIRRYNASNRALMTRVRAQRPQKVQSWEVALLGAIWLTDSRLVYFIFSLYSFVLVIGLSFFHETFTSPISTIVTLALVVPMSGLGALRSPLLLGQLLQITDADLLRALPILACCGLRVQEVDELDSSAEEDKEPEEDVAGGSGGDGGRIVEEGESREESTRDTSEAGSDGMEGASETTAEEADLQSSA